MLKIKSISNEKPLNEQQWLKDNPVLKIVIKKSLGNGIYLGRSDFGTLFAFSFENLIKDILDKRVEEIITEKQKQLELKDEEITKLKKELQENQNKISKSESETADIKIRTKIFFKKYLGDRAEDDNKTFDALLAVAHYKLELDKPKQKIEKQIEEPEEVEDDYPPQQVIYDPTKKEDSSDENEEFDEEPFDLASYIKSETCFCTSKKNYGSKGCKKHKAEADKLRKRLGISWEEAWEEVRKKSSRKTIH